MIKPRRASTGIRREDEGWEGWGGISAIPFLPYTQKETPGQMDVLAYIRFRQKSKGVETRQISPEINIDISPDGKIYGIELLNAKEQLIREKKISFTDESTFLLLTNLGLINILFTEGIKGPISREMPKMSGRCPR